MSTEYPDVLGDLSEARQRFEANGVHYLAALEPSTIAPGQTTAVRVWLQSCWDVPVQVALQIPLSNSHQPGLSMLQQRTDVPLEPAEVGELSVPIGSDPHLTPGAHPIRLLLSSSFETRGRYIRSQKCQDRLGDTLLSFTTGLSLASSVGLGYVARTQPEQKLELRVKGSPQPDPSPDLTPTFLSHWTVDELRIQGKARQQVNDQRLFLLPKIQRTSLFSTLLDESKIRFGQAGLTLQIGEAIYLAKILTYAVEYFLSKPERQDALLVPAYALAHRHNLSTDDPIYLVARADYPRLTRLASSLTFGLLRHRRYQEPWTREEQIAVTEYVAQCVELGRALPAEFLYLPLLLGGLMVSTEVQMPGEKPAQSLALLAKARELRSADLAENPELTGLLDNLLRST